VSDFLYLYGFVPPATPAPTDLTGIAGSPIELLSSGDVKAVVGRVPAQDYAPGRIEDRLQDLKWVAEQGVAHERVVAWFVDHAQILPAPLFTMYSSPAALHTAVADRIADVHAELQRLHGHREWDVKIFFDEDAMRENAARLSDKVAQLDQEIAAAAAGKRYLLQKKRADLLKSEVRQAAHRKAIEVIDTVKPHTADTRTLPLPRTDEVLPVVLHAALLVRTEQEPHIIAALEAQTAQLKAVGMDLSFSGPWAPYRFTGEHD
jgi:hypothetical protein